MSTCLHSLECLTPFIDVRLIKCHWQPPTQSPLPQIHYIQETSKRCPSNFPMKHTCMSYGWVEPFIFVSIFMSHKCTIYHQNKRFETMSLKYHYDTLKFNVYHLLKSLPKTFNHQAHGKNSMTLHKTLELILSHTWAIDCTSVSEKSNVFSYYGN